MTQIKINNFPRPKSNFIHKRGCIYLKYNCLFILAQFDNDTEMGLVALDSGNRERDPVSVTDIFNVSEEEFQQMGGDDGFYPVKNLNISIELQ